MSTQLIESGWRHSYDAKILSGLPASGPQPAQFRATTRRLNSEGAVVKVSLGASSWTGNFEKGDGKLSGVWATPSPDHLCVVAGGRAYWVSARDDRGYDILPVYPVQDVRAILESDLLILVDYTEIAAIGREGLRWISDRISWDGIHILHADARGIIGQAWDAAAEQRVGFFVDTETGRLEGGSAPPPSA
jgi:hypothetical protein